MVEPKENGEEHGKGQRDEDVADAELPEPDDPAAAGGGLKRDAGGQLLQLDLLQAAKVDEAGEEDYGERGAVVLEEDANAVAEEAAGAERAARVGDDEDEQGDDDGEVKVGPVAEALEHLDAFLEVDAGDVEAENVAGEARHPAQPVARVGDGEDPVQDEGPS